MSYSTDLRKRVVAAFDKGKSISAVARQFDVARSTVRDWRERARQDRLEPDKTGPQQNVKLTPADLELIRRKTQQQPGITLAELCTLVSVDVVPSTIWRAMQQLGLPFKKSP